jgi:hypothetical protein
VAKIYFEELNSHVCSHAKRPTPSVIDRPSWWKESSYYRDSFKEDETFPKKHRFNGTIKNCPAISDAMGMGYTLYMPMDLYINTKDKEKVSIYSPNNFPQDSELNTPSLNFDFIGFHKKEELEKFNVPKDYCEVVIKINPFFGVRTDPGYSVWVTGPMYKEDTPLKVLDGIIDTDKNPMRFHYPMFIKEDFDGVILAGTPIIQIIPFKREDWSSEIVPLDRYSLNDIQYKTVSRFSNSYRKLSWSRKKFL